MNDLVAVGLFIFSVFAAIVVVVLIIVQKRRKQRIDDTNITKNHTKKKPHTESQQLYLD